MNRREFIQRSSLAAGGLALAPALARAADSTFPVVRIPEAKRKFTSPAVEETIARVQSTIANKELAWMFGGFQVSYSVSSRMPDCQCWNASAGRFP